MSEVDFGSVDAAAIEAAFDRSTRSEPADLTARREFERLAAAVRPDLYRYAFWLGRDAALAEDVVQEALLRGWRAVASLREPAAAKRWLLAIVRREHARAFERKQLETTDIDELTCAEQRLIATTDNSDVRDVRQAIFRLDAEHREPLVLQVLLGYKTDEIATIMGINQGAVLTRLFRARRRLKAALGLEGGEQ